jgi:diguanylate cyclase (GGDEF)-like protein
MKLDIMTLLVMNLIVNAVSAWAMAVIWREHRRRYPGIGFWLANMLLQTGGLALILSRGRLPDLFCVLLANLMMQSGAVLLFAGLARFTEAPSRQGRNMALLAFFALAMAYYLYRVPNMQARQIVVSVSIILITGQAAWLLLRDVAPRFRSIASLAGYVLVGFVATSLGRIVLILTNPAGAQDFFRSGAADALAITLYTTLNACLAICLVLAVNRRLLADVGALKDELEILATHDALTGLPNRPLFYDRLAVALAGARRQDVQLAVMSVDLDGFKGVNDSLGHPAGDLLLQEAARRLAGCLRASDTVSRFGGDEFLLLIGDVGGPGDALAVAAKILAAFREPFALDGREARVSASIGVALSPAHGREIEELVRRSDEALYRAKAGGRDACRLYGEDAA